MVRAGTLLAATLALFAAGAEAQQQPRPPGPPGDPLLEPYGDTRGAVTLADGRRIHLVCMGKGSPAVILTSGLGDWSGAWARVQPAVAKTTRVCAWDRAGFGFSDASPHRQTVEATSADLEAALGAAGIGPPWILVGHSLGGFESLLIADRRRDSVAGMVLVDPSVPDQIARLRRIAPALAAVDEAQIEPVVERLRQCAGEVRQNLPREPGIPDPCKGYPFAFGPGIRAALAERDGDPARFDTRISLFSETGEDARLVINPRRNYGDMPLIVLSATQVLPLPPGSSRQAIAELPVFLADFSAAHDELAALSSRGVNARVPGSSHAIHQLKPQAVIDAIDAVVAQARTAK